MRDLRELEAFVSVVRTGSLAASTLDLGLPKSTLSRRIKNLEDALGQPLLLRKSRKIVPNEAGRVFYRYSHDVLALLARASEALDELKEEVSGQLILKCHESLVRGWFSRLVETFLADHAGLQAAIQTQRSVPDSLESGVCLWLGPVGETVLRQETLGSLSQGVFGSPEYFGENGMPATPGELAEHPWVDVVGDNGNDLQLYNSRQRSCPVAIPARRLTVDQFCVQGDVIAGGRGLGLMPHWLVELRMRSHPGSFQCCLPDWQGPQLPVTLLYPHGHIPRRVRAFIAHIRGAVPAEWAASGAAAGQGCQTSA